MRAFILAALAAILIAPAARAEPLRLAVAANFLAAAEALAPLWAARGHDLPQISSGATGALYSQITLGAPFDLFLAADAERPERLMQEGAALAQKPYALGQLMLFHADAGDLSPRDALQGRLVALADPALAPYGVAALQAIAGLGLDAATDMQLVTGANVGQAAALYISGAAPVALVAASQAALITARRPSVGLAIDPALYDPIQQHVALLSGGAQADQAEQARAFFDFLSDDAARAVIAAAGYGLPQ